jgi:hypothetical protein
MQQPTGAVGTAVFVTPDGDRIRVRHRRTAATASRVGAAFACGAIASQPAVGIAFWLQRPSDTTRGDAVA